MLKNGDFLNWQQKLAYIDDLKKSGSFIGKSLVKTKSSIAWI